MFQKQSSGRKLAEVGYYSDGHSVFVVKWNRSKSSTYAMRMDIKGGRGKWNYAEGTDRFIANGEMDSLTVEEAARLGHLHGACVVCGSPLTDPESVTRGMGPVCLRKVKKGEVAA